MLYRIINHSPIFPPSSVMYRGEDLVRAAERRQGIPIGNLTSQFFANLFLDRLDHTIKQDWCIPGYIRYVDDLFLFHDSKAAFWQVADAIQLALQGLKLELHSKKVHHLNE